MPHCSGQVWEMSDSLTRDSQHRWRDYCSELYNHDSYADKTVLDCTQQPEDLQPILPEEIEPNSPQCGSTISMQICANLVRALEHLWGPPRGLGKLGRKAIYFQGAGEHALDLGR